MNLGSYPEYRLIESEWGCEVPAHWENKRLRFVCRLNPSKSEIDLPEDAAVSFLPMEAVGELGGLNLDQEKPLAEIGAGYTYFADGDVVVAKITPCFENGKGALATGLKNRVGFGTTELHVIRPGDGLDRQFLFYLTISHSFRKIGEATMFGAGGQKRIADDFIKDFVAGLPPTAEQKIIATFLDHETARIDALIEKKRKLLELLEEKRLAVITQAVTKGLDLAVPMKESGIEWLGEVPAHWEIKKLSRLLLNSPKNGISPPITSSGATPTFSITAVQNGVVNIEQNLKLTEIDSEGAQSFLIRTGDILALRGNGNIKLVGKAGIITEEPPKGCIYPDILIKITPNKTVNPMFIVAALNSYPIRAQIETAARTAAGIWKISGNSLSAIQVPVPPTKEQIQIVDQIKGSNARIYVLVSKIQNALKIFQEYRAALITNAVTGKIDVRGIIADQNSAA